LSSFHRGELAGFSITSDFHINTLSSKRLRKSGLSIEINAKIKVLGFILARSSPEIDVESKATVTAVAFVFDNGCYQINRSSTTSKH
jgi:hypothetical protein